MLIHLVTAEQFRSKRWLVASVLLCQTISAQARLQTEQVPGNGLAAYVQGRDLFSGSEVSMEPERVAWQLANLPYFTLEIVNLIRTTGEGELIRLRGIRHEERSGMITCSSDEPVPT